MPRMPSKAGLDQLSKVMAVELGPHNIRVNSINPTVVRIEMSKRAWSDFLNSRRKVAIFWQEWPAEAHKMDIRAVGGVVVKT